MCDTNWCTFCDCAVNPYSDSVYCSEECFIRDASFTDNNLPQSSIDNVNTSLLSLQCSNTSICSTDRAVMNFDLIPNSSPPVLSTSVSPIGSHDDITIGTPIHVSGGSSICEKLDTTSSSFMFNSLPRTKV